MYICAIVSFTGYFDFLSNFYECNIHWEGKDWPSVEHAYQSAKTSDLEKREEIRKAKSPAIAKKLGRKLQVNENWEAIKEEVMNDLLYLKFSDHPLLRNKLLETEPAVLIEGNNWGDRYWGAEQVSPGVWEGKNKLGILLMRQRQYWIEPKDLTFGLGRKNKC